MLVQVCISVDDTIKEAEEAAWSLVSGQGLRRDLKDMSSKLQRHC